MRSGTVPHTLVVGLGAACDIANQEMKVHIMESERVLTSRFFTIKLFLRGYPVTFWCHYICIYYIYIYIYIYSVSPKGWYHDAPPPFTFEVDTEIHCFITLIEHY